MPLLVQNPCRISLNWIDLEVSDSESPSLSSIELLPGQCCGSLRFYLGSRRRSSRYTILQGDPCIRRPGSGRNHSCNVWGRVTLPLSWPLTRTGDVSLSSRMTPMTFSCGGGRPPRPHHPPRGWIRTLENMLVPPGCSVLLGKPYGKGIFSPLSYDLL